MKKIALAALAIGFTVACSSQLAVNMTSDKLEFYSDGCDGYLFESSVQLESAILSRTLTDGTDAGSLVFRAAGGDQYVFDPQTSSPNLITDNEPAAIATLKKNRICYHFTMEDAAQDPCLASLIKTGAICTNLKPAESE